MSVYRECREDEVKKKEGKLWDELPHSITSLVPLVGQLEGRIKLLENQAAKERAALLKLLSGIVQDSLGIDADRQV
jgi:hypothetical protein